MIVGSLRRLAHAAVEFLEFSGAVADLRTYLDDAFFEEHKEIRKYNRLIITIVAAAPLLGLLGTVIGMIKVFSSIMVHGVGDANQLAGGISEALITTAAGLTVAIPSFFFYRYYKGKVEAYVVSMEEQAVNLVEAIEQGNVAQLRSNVPGG